MEDKALAEKSRPRAGPGTVLWPAFPGWGRGAPISHAWGWVPPGPHHSHASQGGCGLAPLTTCLRLGWSCRWGPRRVRSAARLSSHHCGASGGSQEPIRTQRAPGPVPYPAAEAQGQVDPARSLRRPWRPAATELAAGLWAAQVGALGAEDVGLMWEQGPAGQGKGPQGSRASWWLNGEGRPTGKGRDCDGATWRLAGLGQGRSQGASGCPLLSLRALP